jgi:hypothetical protein
MRSRALAKVGVTPATGTEVTAPTTATATAHLQTARKANEDANLLNIADLAPILLAEQTSPGSVVKQAG